MWTVGVMNRWRKSPRPNGFIAALIDDWSRCCDGVIKFNIQPRLLIRGYNSNDAFEGGLMPR